MWSPDKGLYLNWFNLNVETLPPIKYIIYVFNHHSQLNICIYAYMKVHTFY